MVFKYRISYATEHTESSSIAALSHIDALINYGADPAHIGIAAVNKNGTAVCKLTYDMKTRALIWPDAGGVSGEFVSSATDNGAKRSSRGNDFRITYRDYHIAHEAVSGLYVTSSHGINLSTKEFVSLIKFIDIIIASHYN